MLIIKYFSSAISNFIGFDSIGKNHEWKSFVGIRLFLSLLLLSGFLVAGFAVGAQILNPSDDTSVKATNGGQEKLKRKGFDNFDVRVNGQQNLSRISELSSLDRAKVVITQKTQEQSQRISSAVDRLKENVPSADVTISPLTGAVEIVRSSEALTGINPGRKGFDIVRDFIAGNGQLYGLRSAEISKLHFIGESVSSESGLRMVRVEQMVNEHPVFQSETRFILDREGRIIQSLGLFVPQASSIASRYESLLSPQEALRLTAAQLGISLDASRMNVSDESDEAKTILQANDEQITDKVTSKIVYFAVAPGVLIPAWSQIIFTPDADYYVLVDARNGTLLWRKNIRNSASSQDARFRVYVQADGVTPADNPAPQSPNTVVPGSGMQFPEIAPTIVSMLLAQDLFASPNGWINDCPAGGCTANETQTLGNNALVCMDRAVGGNANICDTVAASVIDGNGRPTGNPDANSRNRDFLGTAPRDFQTNYLPPPQGGNPEAGQTSTGAGNNGTLPVDQFRRGAITHLFYLTNWYHDKLYRLGFDEAAGNFQLTNFSGMGVGNDRVLGDAQDGTSVDNANFSTPPDGTSGRMQMYNFTGPTIDRDGGLDAEIVLHELTHGTSNRLVGNGAGLLWDSARGMGEGWSDFYALSLLNNTNADNPNSRFASGAYATYKLSGTGLLDNYVYGIRRFPYSTDNSVNPLTWADVDDVTNNLSGGIAPSPVNFNGNGGMEVHNVGELWANTLWEVRSRVIADPAGANGSVPTGNQKMLQIVTDGLKMTPINPSFSDARDAIINADCATNACANEQSIWDGFADRGLGYKSISAVKYGGRYVSSHLGIGESFASPNLDNQTVTVDDSVGNNNGSIDPGEPVKITVNLLNPWRNATKGVASATATLTTSTTGITITDGNSAYPAIPAQGNANGDTFAFTVSNAAVSGSAINFTMTINSSLGTITRDFTLRVGQAAGNGAPITYTSTIAGGLTITNNSPRGAFNTLNITDDYEIADLDFRVSNATSPSVGDLTFMLKGPNGYGTDLIALIDGLNDLGGTSIVNMVIDDDLPAISTNDMVQATTVSSPYTKSWLPVYNSPWAALVNPAVPGDPVGELNPYNGLSTKGNWTILGADVFSAATGGTNGNSTLNSWSIIVTPKAFTVTPFVNTAPTLDAIPNQTILEDAGAQTVNLTGITAGSESGQSLTVTATSNNTALIPNPTVTYTSPNTTGSLSYTPVANASGTAMITVTVMDDGGTSGGGVDTFTRTFTVTVTAVNDAPTLDAISNQAAILEDAGAQTVNLSGITAGGGESQTLTVTATSNNTALIPNPTVTYTSPNTTGSLSYTPVANASGTATITVTVMDNGGTANGGVDTFTRMFTVTVTSVNDAPTLDAIGNQTILEDAGAQTVSLTGISAGGGETGQTLTISAVSNNTALIPNPTVTYTSPNTTGSLSYTPVANASGTAIITVTVMDNGGTANGGVNVVTRTFNVIVTAVNDAPSFTKGANQTTTSNSGAQTVPNWATNISAGPPDESGQTLQFNVTNNNNAIFAVQPAISPSGTLTYTPSAPGTATVTVTLTDNGGTTNGGQDTSAPQTFTITIQSVSGAISFSSANYSVNENVGTAIITVTRASGSDGTVSVDYSTVAGGTAIGGTSCIGNVDYLTKSGTLTFTNGVTSQTISVTICDDAVNETTETFNLTLSAPTGGATIVTPSTAVVSIIDNDAIPTITVGDTRRLEGNSGTTNFFFNLTLSAASGLPITVSYQTSDGTATSAGNDYVATAATLVTFNPGDTSKPILVIVNGDTLKEANETFFVNLSSPTNATIAKSQGLGIIIDEDRAYTADFDRDRKTDFSVFRPSNGYWYILQSANNVPILSSFGAAGDILTPGDYDGDGKTDLAYFRPQTGTWFIMQSSTSTVVQMQFGQSGDIPVQGDYDGSGKTQIALFRPQNGVWYTSNNPATNYGAIQFGQGGDIPVPGDYDGDARTDLAIYRSGTWYVRRNVNGAVSGIAYGLASDKPVIGDFDGDGKTDFTVYRPSAGTFYTFQSLTNASRAVIFGISEDVPTAGDYDGDGTTDISVWRPSNGTFYFIRSSDGSISGQQWGQSGDVPVTSQYPLATP